MTKQASDRIITGGLIGAVAVLVGVLFMGCQEAPTAPTPAPDPVVVVTPPPVPVVVVPPAPFCSYPGFANFRVTQEQPRQFIFSWEPAQDTDGTYLRRYQIEVFVDGKGVALLEAEVDKLGGRQNRTAFWDWTYAGAGQVSARIRIHYAGACRDDGAGNVRANGPWSEIEEA